MCIRMAGLCLFALVFGIPVQAAELSIATEGEQCVAESSDADSMLGNEEREAALDGINNHGGTLYVLFSKQCKARSKTDDYCKANPDNCINCTDNPDHIRCKDHNGEYPRDVVVWEDETGQHVRIFRSGEIASRL